STQSLGFLPPVSHLGRAVQLLTADNWHSGHVPEVGLRLGSSRVCWATASGCENQFRSTPPVSTNFWSDRTYILRSCLQPVGRYPGRVSTSSSDRPSSRRA